MPVTRLVGAGDEAQEEFELDLATGEVRRGVES